MKQKDIVLIIVIVFFSAVASLLLSNILLAPASDRQTQVEVVGPITAEFNEPDDRFFNANSINPTQIIRIGGYDNPDPFTQEQN